MKRILSVLLLCSLLVTLLLPCAAAQETDEISTRTLERALAFAQTDTSGALTAEPAPKTQSANDGFLPKGLADDDNLILPGPLMANRAVTPGAKMTLPMILVQTGKTGQYRCTAIYYGDDLDAEPVGTNVEAFGTQEGMQECNLYWDTKGMKTGDYTIVCFTARQSGSQLIPVEGSASAVKVYIQNNVSAVQKLSFADWETGKSIKKLNMGAGDVALIAVTCSPTPSRGTDRIDITYYNGQFSVDEYSGLLVISARDCGWGEVAIRDPSYRDASLELNACVDAQGHSIDGEIVAREPDASIDGLSLKHCARCGGTKRETLLHYLSYFYKAVDVPESEWYYTYVRDAVGKNLFRGVSAHHFAPDETMTRAMLVTVLWRYEGEPQVGGTPFTDVRAKDWYAVQVAWAAQNGVVNGVGKGKFDPEGMVTREQMAAVLYRYAQQKGFDTSMRGDLSAFADSGAVSPWATEAMRWAVGSGLIGGSTSGGKLLLHPGDGATRAEVAAILVRFVDKIADPLPPMETVDPTGAEAGSAFETDSINPRLEWAFFPDGTLVIGGIEVITAAYPDGSDGLWGRYSDRVKTIKVLYGVQELRDDCFRNYAALETVEIADSVRSIGKNAFDGCVMLRSVTLSEGLRYIDNLAFANCSLLAEIALPRDLMEVGDRAFYGCTSLTHIELPDAIIGMKTKPPFEGLGNQIFMNCTALESVKLPIALEHIPNGCFYGCTSLTQVEIPSQTHCIALGAFYGCDAFEEIVLPPTVNIVEPAAFNGCANLTKITVLNRNMLFFESAYNNDVYQGGKWPLGDPEKVTVCGYAGSNTQTLAEEYGYKFEPIAE